MHAAYDRQPVLSPHRPFSRTSAPHPVTYGRPLVADIGASQRHPVSLRPRVPRQALPRPRFSRGFPRGLGSLPPSQSPPLTSLGAPSPRESVTDLSKKKKTLGCTAVRGAGRKRRRPHPNPRCNTQHAPHGRREGEQGWLRSKNTRRLAASCEVFKRKQAAHRTAGHARQQSARAHPKAGTDEQWPSNPQKTVAGR